MRAVPRPGLRTQPSEPDAASTHCPPDAEALYVSPTLTFDGRVVELSARALFVASDLVDPVGTQADVLLFSAGSGGARFGAVVTRAVAPGAAAATAGMGLVLTEVDPLARRWLDHYLASHGEPVP